MKQLIFIISIFYAAPVLTQKIGHPDSLDIRAGRYVLSDLYLYSTLAPRKEAKAVQRYLCEALSVRFIRNRKERESLLSERLVELIVLP